MQVKLKVANNERIDKPDFDALSTLTEEENARARQAILLNDALATPKPRLIRGLHVRASTGRVIRISSREGTIIIDDAGRLLVDAATLNDTIDIGTETIGYVQAKIEEVDGASGERIVFNSDTGQEELQNVHIRTEYELTISFFTTEQSGYFTLATVDTSGLGDPEGDAITDACIEMVAETYGDAVADPLPGFTTQSAALIGGNILGIDDDAGFNELGGRVRWGKSIGYYRAVTGGLALTGFSEAHEGSESMGVGRVGEYVIDTDAFASVEGQIKLIKELMKRDRGSDSWAQAPYIRNSSINANTVFVTIGDGIDSFGHVNGQDLGDCITQALNKYPLTTSLGFEICVKPGFYKVGDGGSASRILVETGTHVPMNVTIRGAGGGLYKLGATTVALYEDSSNLPLIQFEQANNVLQDITFILAEDINAAGTTAQSIIKVPEDAAGFEMKNVSIIGSGVLYGSHTHGNAGASGAGNGLVCPAIEIYGVKPEISGCVFDGLSNAAIYSEAGQLAVKGSYFADCGPVIAMGEGNQIEGNRFLSTKQVYYIFGVTSMDVGAAVYLRDAQNTNISKNVIKDSEANGIGSSAAGSGDLLDAIVIDQNIIDSPAVDAINLQGCVNMTKQDGRISISKNVIKSAGVHGIVVNTFEQVTIANNIIDTTGQRGIWLLNTWAGAMTPTNYIKGGTIRGNQIHNVASGALLAYAAILVDGTAAITGNQFSNISVKDNQMSMGTGFAGAHALTSPILKVLGAVYCNVDGNESLWSMDLNGVNLSSVGKNTGYKADVTGEFVAMTGGVFVNTVTLRATSTKCALSGVVCCDMVLEDGADDNAISGCVANVSISVAGDENIFTGCSYATFTDTGENNISMVGPYPMNYQRP
jgi:hypothetical protein